MDPTTDDAPQQAGLTLPLVVAVVTLLGVAAVIGIPIYQVADERWHPQAEAFMTTFVDVGGEGHHERFSQLNGFNEDVRDFLVGEYRVDGLDLDQALALVGGAADAAGYHHECRETRFERVEGRIDDSAEWANSIQQCLLTEGNDGRGWVVIAVFDSDALFDIDAGHGRRNYWP